MSEGEEIPVPVPELSFIQWCGVYILAFMIFIIACAAFFLLVYLFAWVRKKLQSAMIVSILVFISIQLIVKFKFIKPPRCGKKPVNKTKAKRIENEFIWDLTWGIIDIIKILSRLGEKDEGKRRSNNDKRSTSGFGGTKRR